jgi:aldose 1-epimerase
LLENVFWAEKRDTMKKAAISVSCFLALAILGVGTSMGRRVADEAGVQADNSQAINIGGKPVVTLVRPRAADQNKPQFLEAVVLPGIGMNLLQLKAFLPGKGEVQVITTMPLPEAKKFLETDNDAWGNNAFKIGAAFLLPYPNRIRGKLSADGKTIETTIAGKDWKLPANWAGKNPGAERHAMHGLILTA